MSELLELYAKDLAAFRALPADSYRRRNPTLVQLAATFNLDFGGAQKMVTNVLSIGLLYALNQAEALQEQAAAQPDGRLPAHWVQDRASLDQADHAVQIFKERLPAEYQADVEFQALYDKHVKGRHERLQAMIAELFGKS